MNRAIIVLLLVGIIALPFALRPKQEANQAAAETLVIITPHNEAIRHEYGRGFADWYRQKTGKTVAVDWRVIGGTSEIARFLEGEYVSAFEYYWTTKLGRPWSLAVQAGFQANPAADAPQEVKDARAEFLKSNVSSGIDLFFGGGTFDFERQANAGRLVDSGIMKLHPEWFTDAVIPQTYTGQVYWDKQGRWIGNVLSSYGIIYNRDSLKRLGLPEPKQWTDLADPRYVGEVGLCDPTKSGSIAAAFENVIQQQMQRRLVALQAGAPANADPKQIEAQAVREGWTAGLQLLQLIGANSRYFTDTSQKPPIDVAAGNCAAGMCIDFYGRQQEEAVQRRDDNSGRVGYVSPDGGSSSSVDPIALLRGAPNADAAKAFIEYVLSLDGQKIWNFKPGVPGGTERFALRRMPVRRDFYDHEEWKSSRSDPDENPYTQKEQLIYRSAWTGGVFREMSFIVRVMCQDTHTELVEAWKAINSAPEASRAAALAAMQDMSAVDYAATGDRIRKALASKDKSDEINLANDLGAIFRRNYARAVELAR